MLSKDTVLGLAGLVFAVLLYLFAASRPQPADSGEPDALPSQIAGAPTPRPKPASPAMRVAPGEAATVNGLRRATLRTSWAIDLESGGQENAPGPHDVWWQGITAGQRCLCPALQSKALFAPLTAMEFENFSNKYLSALTFSANGFRHGADGGEVRPGFTFAVRTAEGGIARARVIDVSAARNDLVLEWEMMHGLGAADASSMGPNASLLTQQLLDLAALQIRGKNPAGALATLDKAAELANSIAPAGSARAAYWFRIGNLYWSARNLDAAMAAMSHAAGEIELPGGSPPSWRLVSDIYWWMGVLNRDLGNPLESVVWHQRSLDAARQASVAGSGEEGTRNLAVTSNLRALMDAECKAGDRARGKQWLQELKTTCAALPGANSIGSCRPDYWKC